jgi:hypothetical protein
MRRLLASALVLAFFSPLIAPVFTASVIEVDLPACCRRNGKHHCVMYRMAMGWAPWPYRTVQDKCPYSPFAHLSVLLFHGYFSPERTASAAHSAVLAARVPQAEAGYRISFSRSRQKRGPPDVSAIQRPRPVIPAQRSRVILNEPSPDVVHFGSGE